MLTPACTTALVILTGLFVQTACPNVVQTLVIYLDTVITGGRNVSIWVAWILVVFAITIFTVNYQKQKYLKENIALHFNLETPSQTTYQQWRQNIRSRHSGIRMTKMNCLVNRMMWVVACASLLYYMNTLTATVLFRIPG